MSSLQKTDLILNDDGSVYHLNLKPDQVSDKIIAVGDPSRVYAVSKYFDDVEFEMNRREFITHTGKYRGKKITVISTGIGTDNIEIFFTELDALFNIELSKREVKSKKKKLNIIRIGTSGSLQEDINVDSHLVSDYALGLDSLMLFYNLPHTKYENDIVDLLCDKVSLPYRPYLVSGSAKLKEKIAYDMIIGNTVTSPGFYAPQGRKIRLEIRFPKLMEELNYFHHDGFWLTNFEMETSAYYAFGKMMGHEVLSVNAILANRITNEFSIDSNNSMDALIRKVLERI